MTLSDKALVTRECILSAATELFYRNGYHATGLEKVIRQAEVTKGNFYYHFSSKEELAIATLEWQFSRLSEDVEKRILSRNKPPLEKLFLLFDYMVGRQKEQYREGQICGCYFGNFALEFSTVSSEVRNTVNRIFRNYRRLIKSLLSRAQEAGQISPELDTARFAAVILGQIEGAILLDKAQQQPDNFYHSIRFIKECLVHNQA
ncbi:TetR/AcrR family transcriptional regulator [Thiolapillus brandeum]|uniref:TetR family transcriptional regulator n=1 Tax=Thiolapillus brandeum TaxID=1076588 RepID=A0A7U6GJ42_9GAMM|nr:TetR/AcrR family transcriptional regulator [Thiolapillus brandeum]BAO44565.1 TetR family transcriptional regulator [Thiolapillus brandeum]